MFNTTTIPTKEPVSFFLNICSILSMGILLGGSMMELFLYRLRVKERAYHSYVVSDSEEEQDSYDDKYKADFEALPLRLLSEVELSNLNTKFVREQVSEKVEVILTFDKATDTFCYYTDQLKEISYSMLETVARKFAIENDCKSICLQAESSPVQAESSPVQAESSPVQAESSPAIFAKFKKYNTGGKGAQSNFTSVVQVVEQMNHFRYRGKICDYEETQKLAEKKQDSDEPRLDYASYKKLLEKKTL